MSSIRRAIRCRIHTSGSPRRTRAFGAGLLGLCLALTLLAQPARAEQQVDEPELFTLRLVEIDTERPDLIPTGRLLERVIHVRRTEAGHYTAAADPSEGAPVRLRELGELGPPDEPPRVDPTIIRAAANAVFQAYSEARIAAVRVSIPQDELPRLRQPDGDGGLVLRVRIGQLSEVRLKHHDPEEREAVARWRPWHQRAAETSPIAAGDPIDLDQVDRHVRWLSRHPGRQVEPVLTPLPPDELALDYVVHEAKPWTIYAQTSNTGTEATHDWRQRFGLIHNNLTGHDDILSLDYSTSRFDEVHAVTASYQRPIPNLDRTAIRGFGSWSRYTASDVGLADLELRGESYRAGLELIQNVHQVEHWFVDVVGGLRYEHADTDNRTLGVRGRTDFLLPSLSLRAERRTREASTHASATVEGNVPEAAGTDRDKLQRLGRTGADRSWVSLQLDAEHSFFLEPLLQENWGEPGTGSTRGHEVALRGRGQYVAGGRRLAPPFTQTLGGQHTVRGYPQSYSSADNLLLGSVEYRIHLPHLWEPGEPARIFDQPFRHRPERELGPTDWNLILRSFLDVGRVIHNDRRVFERNITAAGAGVGAELRFLRHAMARVDWGFALRETDTGTERVSRGSSQVHMRFTLTY